MGIYRLYQVDAFTTEKFRGNPAGVVSGAAGLSTETMQQIAREMNNSETVFILPPDDASHQVKLRYFTPATEVPSCGHATIAAHYVRAVENRLGSCTVLQKIGIGVLPVNIIQDGDYFIWMTQGHPEFSSPLAAPERQALLTALGLESEDLDHRCPVQMVSTGHSKILLGLRSRHKLHSLQPDLALLTRLSATLGCSGYFPFAWAESGEHQLTEGRMFAPAIGIAEDPVTGNANGPLGAYLVKHRLVEHPPALLTFTAGQGAAIGRHGKVEVRVTVASDGHPVQVEIGGRAVIVFATTIEI
ncbi:MAG TPA: PhzF family isomerase [Patescibacteria group bacterium]|nr:PhzF family isomerase [Patescibacteria group bacterium]